MMKLTQLSIITTTALFTLGCKVSASTPENTQPPAIIPAPQTTQANPTTETATKPTQINTFTPHQAIQLAEQHTKGYAIDIELHQGHGNDVYDVETIQGTYEHHVQIDARTGQILSSYSERELDLKPKAKINLSQALQMANQSIAGQVIEASLDKEYLGSHYEIKIISTNGHPYEIKMNANSGEIIRSQIEYDD